MDFYSLLINGISCNEALNHIGEINNCSSKVAFLNMLFLKYYHAHNIHHCAYKLSNLKYWNFFWGGGIEKKVNSLFKQLCFLSISALFGFLRLIVRKF